MGMFDTYRVAITCPLDGAVISDHQGKDGSCLLYTWVEGRSLPLEADEPIEPGPPLKLPGGSQLPSLRPEWLTAARKTTLPPVFTFGAWHGDHMLEAIGETDADDVWCRTRLLEVWSSLPTGEFDEMTLGERTHRYERTERVRLWREGRGIVLDALERLIAHRDHLRAQLPAHGGLATCDTCRRLRRGDTPAACWSDVFLCEVHAASDDSSSKIILR